MKLCDTEIVTFTEGRRSVFRARGTFLEENGACVVRYTEDGDAVTLTVRDGSLKMERSGRLSALFRTGERTELAVLAQEMRGCIPLVTELCRIRTGKNGLSIHLRYRLQYSAGEQKFSLKIAVGIISEEG